MQYAYYKTAPRCKQKVLPYRVVGWDIEPTEMARIPQNIVFQRLISELAVVSLTDAEPNLWANVSTPEARKQAVRDVDNHTFVASLEQGTTTGVLREHIIRMNSSVSCERMQRSAFPSICQGEQPFTRSLSHGENYTRICVPGTTGLSPWTMSRNRQEITEELFLDIVEKLEYNVGFVDERNLTSDYTLHCTVTTTRGYFELGNYRNNYTWGPLLDEWPGTEILRENFNDVNGTGHFPSEK